MNRYPVWKYAIIVIALLVGVLYTLPNFFGEAPAVQVSSAKATVKVDAAVLQRVEEALRRQACRRLCQLEGNSVRARFDTPDNQLKAKDAIQKALIPDPPTRPIVALNLVSRSLAHRHARPAHVPGPGPARRRALHAAGGHAGGLTKKAESMRATCAPHCATRTSATAASAATARPSRSACATRPRCTAARNLIADQFPDLQVVVTPDGASSSCVPPSSPRPRAGAGAGAQAEHHHAAQPDQRAGRGRAGDPAAGLDRIVVQLPGVQDTAKAKDILGRTATLEVRMVDESTEARAAERGQGPCPSAPSATWSATASR
jgi:preprotein translocase subunit SecD